MNNTKDDGGAAFPHAPYSVDAQQWSDGSQGISIRDYFAAAALQGMIAREARISAELTADDAYTYADAMLQARKEGA